MKSFLLSALMVTFALTGCAAATTPDEPEEAVAPPEHVDQATSELKGLDHGKYCLPGEVVHCTLFPVVCTCVPAPIVVAPIATAVLAHP